MIKQDHFFWKLENWFDVGYDHFFITLRIEKPIHTQYFFPMEKEKHIFLLHFMILVSVAAIYF